MALCAALGFALALVATAQAQSERGHTFSFAFGGGKLTHPTGIAVNGENGNVYVVEPESKHVAEFKPKVEGAGKVVGEEPVGELKISHPSAVAVDDCMNGSTPCTEAEDPSVGDVYVVGGANSNTIYKFSSVGKSLGDLKKYKDAEGKDVRFGTIAGLAVDPRGSLFVYQLPEGAAATIAGFSDAAKNEALESFAASSPDLEKVAPGFAVDSEHDFYIAGVAGGGAELISELGLEYKALHGSEGLQLDLVAKVGHEGHAEIPALAYEESSAIAVGNGAEERNDAYLLNVSGTGAEKTTTIATFDPEGALIQRLGTPGLKDGAGVAVDPENGTLYVADVVSQEVDVFAPEPAAAPSAEGLSAQRLPPTEAVPNASVLNARVNPHGEATSYYFEYGPEGCASASSTKAPAGHLEGFGAQQVSTELTDVQPGTYHFCVVAENGIGSTQSAEQTLTVLQPVGGLPDSRSWEMVSPPEKNGAEPEPITREGGVIQAAEDGEAITYVGDGPMPAKDEPEGVRNPEYTQVLSSWSPAGWISQDVISPNSAGIGVTVGEPPEYRFFTSNLALSLVEPNAGIVQHPSYATPPLSPPQSEGEKTLQKEGKPYQENTIFLRDDAPLQPVESELPDYQAALHEGEAMTPTNPGFVPLITRANAPGGAEFDDGAQGEVDDGLEFAGATPDLSHVVFDSYLDAPGLYEWSGPGTPLQLVSFLPGGSSAESEQPSLGQGPKGGDARHAISNNGALVFWTTKTTSHLYASDLETHESIQLDAPEAGAVGEGPGHESPADAAFQTASASGSKVFFTDTERLTVGADAVKESPDLYVFEISTAGGKLAGKLTDLTPNEGAGVMGAPSPAGGGVLGASEEETSEGFNVYFVADGALAPGATRGLCPHSGRPRPGVTCNLYVRHFNGASWEATKFIAALSSEDLPDWGGETAPDLGYMTSRVSPNGRYLAFMSDQDLTGYQTENASTAGERNLDEEVYLYNAADGQMLCASCNPAAALPAGVHDVGTSSGEGIGLAVDRPKIWAATNTQSGADHWLAGNVPGWTTLSLARSLYQSRYLSDSGRLFFDSSDHLVPEASGAKEKVYEYEPDGEGSCRSGGGCVALVSAGASKSGVAEHESAFLDASVSGDDVFFLTAEKLAEQDADGNFDVYDARVCEPSSRCATPPSPPPKQCVETPELPCRGAAPPPQSFSEPPSMLVTASGNLSGVLSAKEEAKPTPTPKPKPKPLTKRQLLEKALTACKKDKQKGKRLACERAARKRYGSAAATHKKGKKR